MDNKKDKDELKDLLISAKRYKEIRELVQASTIYSLDKADAEKRLSLMFDNTVIDILNYIYEHGLIKRD